MGQLEKFLFNVSFDEADLAAAKEQADAAQAEQLEQEIEEEAAPTFSQEELEAARHEGFTQGKEEGIREASDAIETRISDSLSALDGKFQDLFRQNGVATTELFDDATNIALAIARKCFPHLTETQSLRVIEDMVRGALAEIREEPRAMVHVHPVIAEALNDRISALAEAANFEGQVLIIDDADIPIGDCRLTWSSGSAERDMGVIWQRVDEIIEHNLSAASDDTRDIDPESGSDIASADASEAVQPTPAVETSGPEETQASVDTTPPDASNETVDAAETLPEHQENALNINDMDTTEQNQAGLSEDISEPMPEANDTVSDDNGVDETAAHLQAGPGIVEEPAEEAILEPEQPEESAGDEAAAETQIEAAESAPPTGPNPLGT